MADLYRGVFSTPHFRVEIHSNRKKILRLAENLLDFETARGKPRTAPLRVRADLREDPAARRKLSSPRLYRKGDLETRWRPFGKGGARVTTDLEKGTIDGTVWGYTRAHSEDIFQFLFTYPLQAIFARRGLFYLHSSLVAAGKKQLLICGPTRAGKSTLALLFARSGWSPLSDDDCFVQSAGETARLVPFRTKGGVREELLRRYPDLRRHLVPGFRYRGKTRVSFRSFAPSGPEGAGRCAAILFPVFSKKPELRFSPVPKEETLRRLLKATLVRLFPDREPEALWAFYRLASRCPAYELTYGRERMDDIPGSVERLLER